MNKVITTLLLSAFASLHVVAADGTGGYRIQAGDILQITVWREQELSQEVLVRPDGGLSFPLAGDLHAADRTPEQLRTDIQQRLVKYIPDPVVTVSLKAVTGSRIYVVGKVNRPGEFLLARPVDVMQALAQAGGATPFADVNEIRILRREGERQVTLSFRYEEVADGRRLEQNILLRSGDTVVVP
jgi:polysaccharide biosynthesis/export protein